MKNKCLFKKILAFSLACLLFLQANLFGILPNNAYTIAHAVAKSKTNFSVDAFDKVKISSKYAVIMDANTGAILYDKNASLKIYPASTSKVMSAIVAIENSNMDDMLTVSQNALKGQNDNGAHIGLKRDEKISMKDALHGLWIESANDSAIAIAENVSGSEKEFAKLLNKKAKELKLENSHFVTPNGLYDKKHYSTVKDLATITAYALKNPKFYQLLTTHIHELPKTNKRKEPVTIYTSHPMAPYKYNAYPYFVGGKTGYIPESKCNMITVAKKDNTTLICVTGKANSLLSVTNDAKLLLNTAFKNYERKVITRDGDNKTLDTILKSGNYITRHSIVTNNSVSILVPQNADLSKVKFKLDERDLMFPVNKGTQVGTIQAFYNNQLVGSSPICAEKDLSIFLFVIYTAFKIALYALPVILVILIAFAIKKKISSQRMKKAKGPRPYKTHGKPDALSVNSSQNLKNHKDYNRTTNK